MTRFLLIACLLLSPLVGADEASDLAQREARLEQLRANMASVSERLSAQRERAGGLEAELARLEQRLGDERSALLRLDEQIRTTSVQVAERQAAMAKRSAEAEHHQAFLAATVRAAYRRGDASTLRLLLGDFDPAQLQRLLVYRQHLGAARATRIASAQAAVAALRDERQALEQALAKQRDVRQAREQALAQVQSSLNERAAVLAKLESSINDDQAELAAQRAQAASLGELITSLREQLAESGVPGRELGDLSAIRGSLGWPHQGPLLARYGAQRAAGLDWTGLLIGGQAGAPVNPVAAGQVVFADWLRGLGLLLIIDHGKGYLSLYGRNQALYFDVGDYVAPGDVIATVGRSGGRPETALYFELRAEGEPVDPLAWLSPASNQG